MKSSENEGDPADLEFFKLIERHLPSTFSWVMRRLPSDPGCRLWRAPYGRVAGA